MKRRKKPRLDTNTLIMLKQIGWGVLAITVTVLVLTSIWFGTRVPSYTLTQVEVSGGQTISHENVSNIVLQQLEGEYAGFIPRSFAWTYPEQDIISALSKVPRIHSVAVERSDSSTLAVSFDEYLPEALWCKTLLAIECVFIDESGYAFGTSPNLTGGSLLRFIHTSQTPEIGRQLTSPEDFQLLQQLANLLAENGWYVSHIEIDKARDAFLRIVDGGEFKVTLTQDPEVTVNNLNVVLTSEEFKEVKPGNFQYIDLRFGNKVFVNEEPPIPLIELTEAEIAGELQEEIEVVEEGLEEEVETATSDDAAGE